MIKSYGTTLARVGAELRRSDNADVYELNSVFFCTTSPEAMAFPNSNRFPQIDISIR